MAITRAEVQITWGSSNSTSVSGGGTATSDTITPSSSMFQGQLFVKIDHSGTPGSGDTVDFWFEQSGGDPDGTGSNEFETDEQGTFSATLDANADDPARSMVELPIPQVAAELLAKNNAGESVTVSATIVEQTG